MYLFSQLKDESWKVETWKFLETYFSHEVIAYVLYFFIIIIINKCWDFSSGQLFT